MKKLFIIALATGFCFTSDSVFAQAKKSTKPAAKPAATAKPQAKKELTPEEEQKVWMEYAEVGPIHKMLSKSDGKWNVQTSHWMKPGMDPMVSEGVSENRMIMGGRYQVSNFTGNMMGMPFEGMSITGYDNAKKVFVSTWIDNFGTGIMSMTGKWNEKTRSVEFTGKMTDPQTKSDMPFREVWTMKDENTQVMEMYGPNPDGKGEFKTMELIFKRG